MKNHPQLQQLAPGADIPADIYGERASWLVQLMAHDLPLPKAYALSAKTVREIALGTTPDLAPLLDGFGTKGLVSVRSSPIERVWGGAETLLNVGMNEEVYNRLSNSLGAEAAGALYCKFVQDFAVNVARLDPEDFGGLISKFRRVSVVDYEKVLAVSLSLYEDEMEEVFPVNPLDQLAQVLRSMAKAWESTTARILRQARGAPADAGLGLIVQRMALGLGKGESGAGVAQFISPVSGEPQVFGRYKSQSQGRDALEDERHALFLSKDPRGPALEDVCPNAYADLQGLGRLARMALKDEMSLEFTVEDGQVWLLDAIPAERSGRAAVAIAVGLAQEDIITRNKALMQVAPLNLTQLLHSQVDKKAVREVIGHGMAASPGAACGRIVFTATAAQASAAREDPCILVRVETSPEDIRGMHSAQAVLTERGGMTSHAAMIARGLGLPCVVGATDIDINQRDKTMTLADGRVLKEGDWITLDGETGDALLGAVKLLQPNLGGAFETFMNWADQIRDIGVRANADTPHDARLSRAFKVDGIGLCRTEHMFFEPGRLTLMRELIFTENQEDRRTAINLLLPMQRSDFVELFQIMQGLPVCIRLLDPPLHEFLPRSRIEMQALAEVMDLQVSQVSSRVEDLTEINPMLGMRGVRLGITVPEIYEMQARAIFEAVVEVNRLDGQIIEPEIMIPLVSANREVELVKTRVEAIAAAVRAENNTDLQYKLGVMVETPRAALRAGDLALSSSFLSFGTNDLTQMTYGLSRDDAGRFMREYVNLDVFAEDPFLSLDLEGVGELLLLAVDRSRDKNPTLQLGLCGEHGGDPISVAFCRRAGFDYVSCSAFRTPIARLAAAQAVLAEKSR